MKPRLVFSDLGGRVYVVTRYREEPNGVIVASTKYDVTEDFAALMERRDVRQRVRHTAKEVPDG